MNAVALVEFHYNEPMTTSLAIAEGVKMEHKSVIQLVRKYVGELQEFGTSAFEMRKSGGLPTEIAWLNEQQATFLLTLMRNSEIVVRFKVALVKAFFELRDRIKASAIPEYSNPMSLNHRADIAVSADRTFRAMMRSGRAAGLPLPNALRRANEITIQKTGVDMLGELGVVVPMIEPARMKQDFYGIARFFEAWAGNSLPVPYTACKTTDFYRSYCLWAKQAGADVLHNGRFFVKAREHEGLAKKTMTQVVSDDLHNTVRLMMPTGLRMKVGQGEFGRYLGKEMERFSRALKQWEAAA